LYYITLMLPGRKGEGMIFASLEEADLAYALGVIDMHALIKVRLPADRRVQDDETEQPLGAVIETTYGRILFNMMLPAGMDFYNMPLKSGDLAR
jgi:DNA-directed RNA polymerase subunit beta'